MKQTMDKIVKCAVLAVTAAAAIYGGAARGEVEVLPMASAIYSQGMKPMSRIELTTVGLPGNSDLYMDRETAEGYELAMGKLQVLPIQWGPVSFGGVAQLSRVTVDGYDGFVEESAQAGIAGRVEAAGDFGYAKTDFNCLASGEWSAYGLLDTEKVFAEGLCVHNPETGNYVRINFDRKVTDHVLIGPQIESIDGESALGLRVAIQ